MRVSILLLLLGPWSVDGGALAAAIDTGLVATTEPSDPQLSASAWTDLAQHSWLGPEGAVLPFRNDSEILEFLRTAAIVSARPITKGINDSRKVLLEQNGVRAHAVFRRVSTHQPSYRPAGGRHSDRFRDGSFRDSCFFEPAAYELGRRLGIRRIPPVVERRYLGWRGTLQLWVENAFDEQARLAQGLRSPHPEHWQRQRIVRQIFDSLIYNIDRNQGNVLIDPDWNVWLIDHTRSFVARPELTARNRIKRCDRDLWEHLRTVDRQTVVAELEPFLTRRELKSLLIRWQKLVDHIQRLITENGESSVLF